MIPSRFSGLRSLALLAGFGLLFARCTFGQAVVEFTVGDRDTAPFKLVQGPDAAMWCAIRGGVLRITASGYMRRYGQTKVWDARDIVVGPDGALWFTETMNQKVSRITTSGTLTQYPVPAPPAGLAAGPDGALWFTEFQANRIGRITTGGVVTEFAIPTPAAGPWAIAAGPDGNLWFTEFTSSRIGRISTAGVVAEFALPTPAASPNGIAMGPDGNLWFTESSARNVGRITTDGAITEFPVPGPATGIVAGLDGALWFTGDKNKIGRITTAGVVTLVIPTNEDTYGIATGPDGRIWFTEWQVGRVGKVILEAPPPPQIDAEFALLSAMPPYDIAAGPDGAMWFAQTDRIGRIAMNGAITEFAAGLLGWVRGIAAGPDGALWFTDFSGNKIGRITTAGALTEFTVTGSPLQIAAGPDGALWFTEHDGHKIGRITTDGSVTEFPVPTTDASLDGIAAGPDGAVWFTEGGIVRKIGRIASDGTITEFPLPQEVPDPNAITAGPDGNLWFTAGHFIGRITPAGVITLFPYAEQAYPEGIAAGPDGALWFTETSQNRIYRVTTQGIFSSYMIPTGGSGPGGIAAGPDGALWFTEHDRGIGRIAPRTPVASRLYTIAPCRLIDTRESAGPFGGPALHWMSDRVFTVNGECGVPPTARAIAANVTVTLAPGFGNLIIYPPGSTVPVYSTINYRAWRARSNSAVIPIQASSFFIRAVQGDGDVHVILDVSGYFE